MKHLILTLLIVSTSMFMYAQTEPFAKSTWAQKEQRNKEFLNSYWESYSKTSIDMTILIATVVIPPAAILNGVVKASTVVARMYPATKVIRVYNFAGSKLTLFAGNSGSGLIHILERHFPFIINPTTRGKGTLFMKSINGTLRLLDDFIKAEPKLIQMTSKGKATYEGVLNGVKYRLKVNTNNKSITSFYKLSKNY